jgi:hypothetical protein
MTLARYRKAAAPALSLLAQGVTLGVLHGTALAAAELVLSAATLAGVVLAPPNAPAPATGPLSRPGAAS